MEHDDWGTFGTVVINKSKKGRKATSNVPEPTALLSLANYPVVSPLTVPSLPGTHLRLPSQLRIVTQNVILQKSSSATPACIAWQIVSKSQD